MTDPGWTQAAFGVPVVLAVLWALKRSETLWRTMDAESPVSHAERVRLLRRAQVSIATFQFALGAFMGSLGLWMSAVAICGFGLLTIGVIRYQERVGL